MREEWQENELRNAMGKVSRRNRVTLSRYIKLKRANGLKVGTPVNYVYWLRKIEEHSERKAFEALTPDDLTAFFADRHTGHKAGKNPCRPSRRQWTQAAGRSLPRDSRGHEERAGIA